MLLLYLISFGMVCFYFYFFPDNFWFPFWFLLWTIGCSVVSYLVFTYELAKGKKWKRWVKTNEIETKKLEEKKKKLRVGVYKDKIDKLLTRLTEETQIRNERGDRNKWIIKRLHISNYMSTNWKTLKKLENL